MRFFFWWLCAVSVLSAGQLEVEIQARSAILVNANTGAVLFDKEAYVPSNPASTTKIATALYVLEQGGDLNQLATVSREALKSKPKGKSAMSWWHEPEGTMMGLKVGEKISFDALLHGMMLISGNDAANVIAEEVGGSIPEFMQRVNEYLLNIGCKSTQFTNPHGLTDANHWTTAYDLALMTRKALQSPKFRQVVATQVYKKPETNKQPQGEIKLYNPLLKLNSQYYYPKAIGVKTGYTQAAGCNLVAAAEHEGRTLIAVLLGCASKGERFEMAKKLFETAFSENKATRRLMGPEHIFTKEVLGSKRALKASLINPLSIAFFPSEELKCKAVLHWDAVQLPLRKGQKVGEVHILDEENQFLEKGDLIALEELKGNFFFVLKDTIRQLFK